jgi:hypothetical protein
VAKKGIWEVKRGRWVAKLVARLIATAALWARIQTSLKNIKIGVHKQRSGQPTLARQKIEEKCFFFSSPISWGIIYLFYELGICSEKSLSSSTEMPISVIYMSMAQSQTFVLIKISALSIFHKYCQKVCTVNNRSEKRTVHDSSCSNQRFRNSFLEISKNVI